MTSFRVPTDDYLERTASTAEGRAHLQESIKRMREMERVAREQVERMERAITVAIGKLNA